MLVSAGGAAAILFLVRPMGWGLDGVWWGITALMGLRAITLAVPYVRHRLFAEATAESASSAEA
jgi:MATE family multidrug resistance protein